MSDDIMPPTFTGFRVQVAEHMTGSKRAIRMGSTIYVSPAMHDLMKNANEDELRRLFESIPLVTIPEPPLMLGPLPMAGA